MCSNTTHHAPFRQTRSSQGRFSPACAHDLRKSGLSRQDAANVSNYRIDGPEHLLLFADFPRRVRAVFADVAVLDITRGRLLHETGSLPVLYVPEDDVTASVLQPADHVTQSDATHWTVEVGNRTAENAF